MYCIRARSTCRRILCALILDVKFLIMSVIKSLFNLFIITNIDIVTHISEHHLGRRHLIVIKVTKYLL